MTGNSSDTQIDSKNMLYLYYRLGEPLYYPKGDQNDVCYFDLSPDYLPNKYREKAPTLLSRFGENDSGKRIDIGSLLNNALLRIPIDKVQVVPRRSQFSLFLKKHQKAAAHLIEIFMGLLNINDLMAFSAYVRDQVNPQLFAYALSTALLHREDTKNLRLPTLVETFPEKFVASETVADAKESAQIFQNSQDRVPIEIPRDYTGNDSDPEHRLAYFREDMGVNLHHWHWHLIYPIGGPEVVVNKDRRGELFYYLHHQIIARYNVERLCNSLNLVHRLLNWDAPIPEAYYPMLMSDVAGKAWPGRPANLRMSNINRSDIQVTIDIDDLRRSKTRIYESIHKKKVLNTDGSETDINNDQGIDILGNIVEASTISRNASYYGNLHNNGHVVLAYIHDPEYKYVQTAGVMSETTTAMRDPVFYRWHAFIDDIFVEHKNTLPPYSKDSLTFPGVQITSLELCSYNEDGQCSDRNTLNTHFMKNDIDMSRGLDFTPRGPVLVRVTHLNHNEFEYTIRVRNTTDFRLNGTVRIFLAPTLGFGNNALSLTDQKNLMIELDRFVAIIQPGDSTILRKSTQSSTTIPFEQTFRNLDADRPDENNFDEFDKFNYCGCGWPQHMLVPKGTTGGYSMVLFCMISDYEQDRVESTGESGTGGCRTGVTFCGLRDKKFPDKRPMGYPFERPVREDTLQDFLTPNMFSVPITVFHSEEVREGRLVSENAIPAQRPGDTTAQQSS